MQGLKRAGSHKTDAAREEDKILIGGNGDGAYQFSGPAGP